MSNGSHLVPVDTEHQPDGTLELADTDRLADETEAEYEDWDEEESERPAMRRSWIAPTLALLAIAGWTGFFGWVNRAAFLDGAAPAEWADMIVSWSVPVVLTLAVWFLALRNSRVEARRYGAAAAALSHESAQLETRLTATNRELSLAREFIAAQSRDLEHLGRVAAQRLSENAARIEELIGENQRNVDRIAEVSTTALDNMERLRGDLPVVANSARDVANQIGAAGKGAQEQLETLVAGFRRLNDFGTASERQVDGLRDQVGAVLAELELRAGQIEALSEERFVALRERSKAFRGELDSNEVEALAAIHRRADVLKAGLDETREQLAADEAEAIAALERRVAALQENAAATAQNVRDSEQTAAAHLGATIAALQDRLRTAIAEVDRIDQQALEAANLRLAELRDEAERVDAAIVERNRAFEEDLATRRQRMATSAGEASDTLAEKLAALDGALETRQAAHLGRIESLTAQGELLTDRIEELDRRLTALRSEDDAVAAKLSSSSDALVARLTSSREMLESTGVSVEQLTDASVRLLELIQAGSEHSQVILPKAISVAEGRLQALRGESEALKDEMAEVERTGSSISDYVINARGETEKTGEQLSLLRERLGESVAEGEAARDRITKALEELDEAVRNSIVHLREGGEDAVASYAGKIGERSAKAIERAMQDSSSAAIASLDAAAAAAAEGGREAAAQLRDQLAMVNELTGNLERRVADARGRAEEQVDHDFSRRVALITESLNSNAIDLSKALSNEVSDTAWAAYLKGDRGIFTRRAVRLLDSQETRAIADIYEEDSDFREHVNRYIHDFEAMLRILLSTRDGNALSVTMLSSDMGKLYVALAQAIDRLRD
ncbi:ATPase [Alteriqipengyuania flavescens]|uniref:ATPase n=1 Tax=Alteriqipengyuania flavescens TaxID=3053610 RepID=UPI0025B46576|nr:ATPase [Alteriqipengyuania flavescens]WJY18154.1 ATPase [Alteriqipengyuania flavescens]WJY24095.1 ATPase [Alteriqipengyuania flavescens]